jgi:hypothetical protein
MSPRESEPPAASAARYMQLWVLFAVVQFPVTVALGVLLVLGTHRVVGYWWVVVPLAAELVPGAIWRRALKVGRALSAERPPTAAAYGPPATREVS